MIRVTTLWLQMLCPWSSIISCLLAQFLLITEGLSRRWLCSNSCSSWALFFCYTVSWSRLRSRWPATLDGAPSLVCCGFSPAAASLGPFHGPPPTTLVSSVLLWQLAMLRRHGSPSIPFSGSAFDAGDSFRASCDPFPYAPQTTRIEPWLKRPVRRCR